MRTIDKQIISELDIQKSRFICYMDTVHSEEEAKKRIEECKNMYPGATHYCYAYIIDNVKRFQDDGEPGGTAGVPILHVLESNALQHVVAIVIRYFGGIKLGAGGLVRAYTNCVSECLNKNKIVLLEECNLISIEFDYSNLKQIDYLLQKYNVINKGFDDRVRYDIAISKENINTFLQSILGLTEDYEIKNQIIYEKKD